MGKDKRRDSKNDIDNDMHRLNMLAKLMRGARPPQRNKFHERKRDKSLKDVANDYNAGHNIEDIE